MFKYERFSIIFTNVYAHVCLQGNALLYTNVEKL